MLYVHMTLLSVFLFFFFFSSRRRHTRFDCDWSSDVCSSDLLDIDASTREVTKAGDPVRLTAREFDLLWFLASHPRRVFSRSQLMDRVWGYEAALDTGTVTVHVRRLREKIEDEPSRPRFLETVWGVGYRFCPAAQPPVREADQGKGSGGTGMFPRRGQAPEAR